MITIATVLSTTPVARYVLVFHPSSHPQALQPTVISLANVVDLAVVAVADATISIGSVPRTQEGISLVFTTDVDSTSIFETNITGPTALANARILVLQMKNQAHHPNNQPPHQVSIRSGATVHFLRSVPEHTIATQHSIIHGDADASDVGPSLLEI